MSASAVESHPGTKYSHSSIEFPYGKWTPWPVYWNGVIVGTVAALAVAAIFGLVSVAIGAQLVDPEYRIASLKTIRIETLAFAIFGSFLSFVAGGWVAGKIAGIQHSEPAMLHGAIVWAVSVPLLMLFTAMGAAGYTGGWYGGVVAAQGAHSVAPYERPESIATTASTTERARYQSELSAYHEKVDLWRNDTPKVVRNNAICAASALLLGLIGSVIGGWMACGEPMTVTYRRDLNRVNAKA